MRGHQDPRRQNPHLLTPKTAPPPPRHTPSEYRGHHHSPAQPLRCHLLLPRGERVAPQNPAGKARGWGVAVLLRGGLPPTPILLSPCAPPGVAARPQGTALRVGGGGGSAACLWGLRGGGEETPKIHFV